MYWNGCGWAWMAFMPLLWIVLTGLAVWAVVRLTHHRSDDDGSRKAETARRETPGRSSTAASPPARSTRTPTTKRVGDCPPTRRGPDDLAGGGTASGPVVGSRRTTGGPEPGPVGGDGRRQGRVDAVDTDRRGQSV